MAKGESRSRNIAMEALEGRRLLSSTPDVAGLLFAGSYKSNSGGGGPVNIEFTTQTRHDVLYGTVIERDIDGHKYNYHSFVGEIRGTTITLTYLDENAGTDVTLTGSLNSKVTVYSGKFTSVTAGSKVVQDTGTFTDTRTT